ncbi:MAG TPA: cation:proton antiporter [Vicinamibacterales bacterium]|nr:cation:proton antiporter [Vicinamibacterales bacterium]
MPMAHSLQLLLLLAVIILAAKLSGALANRLGMPSVFGELLAGLILGPTFLNMLGWAAFGGTAEGGESASAALMADIRNFAELGVLLLMFVAGLETDLSEVRRVGQAAFWSALGGVILPLAGGTVVAVASGFPLYWEAIFIGTILTATSVSISAQTLLELGALRSREGSTILSAAVIDDVMGILVLSVVVALARASGGAVDLAQIGIVLVRVGGFFVAAVAAGRWLPAIFASAERLRISQGVLAAALVVALVYSWAAEYAGAVAAITGAYLAGVLVARTPYKRQVDAGIHPLTYSMFVPVFFISIGLQANGRDLGGRVAFPVALIVVAIVTKVLGASAGARASGFTTMQSIRVGVGMISRGEVGLIVASYGLVNGLISQPVFSATVVMVLVTTMVTPPLLRALFPTLAGSGVPIDETIAGPPEAVERDRAPGPPPGS